MLGIPLGVGIFVAIFVIVMILRSFLVICAPDEVVVIEGRSSKAPDGTARDYTVLDAGRAVRIPVIENVRRIGLMTMIVDMNIQNAFSKGNIPLSIHAIANVKICRKEGIIDNALERFLGRSQEEVRQVAKETIEGAVRGVLARLTPEQVNEERATFTNVLAHDVEDDLNQLGLTIDTLNIQSVTDSVNYLDSIGRERIAQVLRDAEIAEYDYQRKAEEEVAAARATGSVARETATANIRRAENDLRRQRAELNGRALREEERTKRAPVEARALAEVELQDILARVTQLKLQADAVLPAEANQVAARLKAEGEAAKILAQGEANAESLRLIAAAWKDAGENAEDIMILEQLDELLGLVVKQIGTVDMQELNLIDGGDGETLSKLAGAYPNMVASVFDSVGSATGISLREVLQRPSKPAKAKSVGQARSFPDPLKGKKHSRFSAMRFEESQERMSAMQEEMEEEAETTIKEMRKEQARVEAASPIPQADVNTSRQVTPVSRSVSLPPSQQQTQPEAQPRNPQPSEPKAHSTGWDDLGSKKDSNDSGKKGGWS